jgi:tetratricopeptide (TPR) repeat protein
MRNKSRHAAQAFPQNRKAAPAALLNELVELFNLGNWEQLALKAQSVILSYPKNLLGWKALGKALLMQGNLSGAISPLTQVIKLSPLEADAHNDLGHILANLGRNAESEASYRRALTYHPKFAEAHNNLAILLADQGRLDEAEAHYRKSLHINPNSARTHNNLGGVHRERGRLNQAILSFRRALELDSNYFDAWFNLGLTQQNLEQLDEAQASFLQALTINPNSDMALNALGVVLSTLGGKDDVAIYCLQRAIEINPNNADATVAFGNTLMRAGQTAAALAMFQRAKELRPLISRPTKNPKADFSVLLLDTPLAGCTPMDYLLSNAAYTSNFYCLLQDEPNNLDFLKTKGDVVVNMISDADNGKELFPLISSIVNSLGLPIINHPRLIMNTDRETIANLIAGIPLCKAPQTRLLSGLSLLDAATNDCLSGLNMPLLVRLAGCHGGDDCEKFTDVAEIANYVSKRAEQNYYVSEYIDYQAEDGYFRKYRLIYVNGELLPYHLAIHNDWLVHYFRTDMSNHEWMRQEEEAFLKNPCQVFDHAHQAALKNLAISTGLDYLGIDCSVDKNGDVLIFEANATMRVHYENNETFAYKNPYISKIKDAFDLMLSTRATSQRAIG